MHAIAVRTRISGLVGAAALAAALAGGCGGGARGLPPAAPPPPGGRPSSVVSTAGAAPPAACPSGGISVDSGIDANGNGVLDVAEVASTQYVCNGAAGTGVLLSTSPEPPGAACPAGGTRIDAGPDADGDGLLDAAEVTSSAHVCDGSAGVAGLNSLTSIAAEPAGANCAAGGLRLTSGLDENRNGTLDAAEVTTTSYVCQGGGGGSNGFSSITATVPEPAGANCAAGGVRIGSGLDQNRNDALDPGEVTTTSYVCNGAAGGSGLTSLVVTAAEPAGANCPHAGLRVTSGLDGNRNGALDSAEVTSTAYVCNGAPAAGPAWVTVTGTSQQAVPNTGYLAASDTARVTITLPAAPAPGDTVEVTGVGLGGWKVAQNAGQTIMTRGIAPEAGANWAPHATSGSWTALASSADGMRLLGATAFSYGTLRLSTDGGATWTQLPNLQGDWSGVASSADGQKLVAVANGGQIQTSADGGATWAARDIARAWEAVASSSDGTRLVAAVANGQLFTSADSGATWVPRETTRNWAAVASSWDGMRLVASVTVGHIHTSTDGGATWTARATNEAWTSLASSSDGSRLYAGTVNGQLYTSDDAGVTWTARDAARVWRGVACSSDGLRAVAATEGNLYTSSDGGATWTPREVARVWRAVTSSADGARLAAAEWGGAIYTSQPSTTPGVSGSISGEQYDAIRLQYVGSDTFVVLSHEGNLAVQ